MFASRLGVALGLLVLAIGLLVLTGWALDIAALKGVLPGLVTMKANTALCLGLCGAALALSGERYRALSLTLALVAVVIGAVTLSQDLGGWQLGIDQLLFRDAGAVTFVSKPGRMSPASALCFTLAGSALALLALSGLQAVRAPLATAAAGALLVIGSFGVLGQLIDIARGRPWWNYTGMALHTAFCFAALGAGILAKILRAERSPWALSRPGTALAVAGNLLMLVLSGIGFDFARQMRQSAEALDESRASLSTIVDLGAEVDELVSAQRAFVIIGDKALLRGREATKQKVADHLVRWRQLMAKQPTSLAGVERVAQLIARRNAFNERSIALRREAGFEAAQRLSASGAGIAISLEIERELNAARAEILQQIGRRTDEWQDTSARALLLLPAGVIMSLVALAIGLVFVNQAAARSRLAQQAVESSAERMAGIVESAMDAIISIDARQRIVLFNAAAERMFGCARADAMGGTLDRFVPTRSRAAHATHVQGFGRTGVTSRAMGTLGTLMALRSDGTEFPIEAAISQVQVGGQAIFTVILRDLSERMAAERTLRESEQRLQAVTEHLSEGLVITDLEGRSLHWNRAAIEMHGYDDLAQCLRELPDFADTFVLRHPDGAPMPLAEWPLARVLAGESLNDSLTHVRHVVLGWDKVFSYSGAMVTAADGRRLAYLTVTDVTARLAAESEIRDLNTRLEERVQERTEQLEAKSRELEGFAYSVAHDLKAPLRGIDGYSRLLLDDYGERLDDEGRQFAANVRTAALQMAALIDDLLSYSRQDRRELSLVPIDLRSFVDRQLAARRTEVEGVDVRVDIATLSVVADREGLSIALRNLIDNAVKFSRAEPHPQVTISARTDGDRAVLMVQDNGCGFDMRFHERIFQIFQRLHRVEDYPGTGIGLALVRKSVERMGGHVWAESTPGEGARFFLDLALAD